MRKNRNLVLFWPLFFMFFCLGAAVFLGEPLPPSAQGKKLTQVLPLKVGQWHKKGELQEYKGEDLYLYINGGAEIYHEYGFKQVVVQEYSNEKGNAISVEVFEMEDSPSAFGIYTFKTTAQGKKLDLGNRCLLEDYYLNFWKGRFIGTLTGFDEEKATVEGLEILAREIADKLQNSGEVPEMVRWLPEKNMNPLSVDYFEGSLGLTNIHQFLPQRIFLPQEGMKGDTGEGIRIILLRFKGKKECLDSLNRAREKFQKSSWYEEVNPLEEGGFRTFRVRGEKKTPLWVQPFRQFLFWVMRASPEKSRKIIKSIQSRIQEDSVS